MDTYDCLADEYYIADVHPTCHNFNTLSRKLLDQWLSDVSGDVLEVGAGRSAVGQIMHSRGSDLHRLEVQDSSQRMLDHSSNLEQLGATLTISDARSIKRTDGSVDTVISSLGDPYNVSIFWEEVWRVLKPGGRAIFTTPSFEWAHRYRRFGTSQDANAAEFTLLNGRVALVPSFVYPLQRQIELIQKAGLIVTRFESVGIEQLPVGDYISPKIRTSHIGELSLIWGFISRRF
jgi:SAM-dependent methyltransferase